MSYSDSQDDLILVRVRAATTVSALLKEFQHWYNWGEYDTTGAEILTKLGKISQGDAEAIATLERSAKGNIARTSSAASKALAHLAQHGDLLASQALERCREYWRKQRQ